MVSEAVPKMTMMNLMPPSTFSFKNTEECPKWKRQFEQYCQAAGLSGESEERQVSTLLYCLSEDAEDVLDTTRISAEDKKKYTKVIEVFDAHFKVLKRIIFECTRFNKRSQTPGESVDHFITELHQLAEHCKFGNMRDELIRDCLVVGIRDNLLSERLQMESELTLDKAKKLIR